MMKRTEPTAQRMVGWTFQHGNNVLTCAVDRQSGIYRLSIVPNGLVKAAMMETFESGIAALRQHAQIAAHLREHGWTLIAYSEKHSRAEKRPRLAA